MTDGRLLPSETVQCPFEHYAQLRAEDPVRYLPEVDWYLVTRYEDCVSVLRDHTRFSSQLGPGLRERPSDAVKEVLRTGPRLVRTVLTNDPPSHTAYRTIAARAFTARRVAALEPAIRAVATELLERLAGRPGMDFVTDFAIPLPILVIADILGVPRTDLPDFKRWSDDAAAVMSGHLSEEADLQCHRSLVELLLYFQGLVRDRRADPHDDLLSALACDDALTEEDVIALAYVILVAGNETTVNLLSSTMLRLLTEPAVAARVRSHREELARLVEEVLRLDSPIQGIPRLVKEDTVVGGTPIPAGARLLAMVGSAHRDPDAFGHPDMVDLGRTGAGHVAFGIGIHFCLGAALSRLEADVAFNLLFDWYESIELADDLFSPSWADNPVIRSLRHLPVRLLPAPARQPPGLLATI
jgi:cytochrome P450